MGKIIDRVRERQENLAKVRLSEWIADAERMQREANVRAMQMRSAQRNVEAECNSLVSMLSLNAQIETSAAIMAGLQNNEEAKRWNALGVRDIERRNRENDEFKAKLEAEGKKNVVVLQSGIAMFEDPEPEKVWWKFWR